MDDEAAVLARYRRLDEKYAEYPLPWWERPGFRKPLRVSIGEWPMRRSVRRRLARWARDEGYDRLTGFKYGLDAGVIMTMRCMGASNYSSDWCIVHGKNASSWVLGLEQTR